MIGLAGCGNSAKSDKSIASEMAERDSIFYSHNLTLDSYNVEKRQTNKDEKTDYVWISLKGSNDEFSYKADYKILYVLYNDGWRFEDYTVLSSKYTVIKEYDRSDIERQLSKEYDSIEFIEQKNDGNNVAIFYSAKKTQNYILTNYSLEIDLSFSPATSWIETNREVTEAGSKLDIIGEWKYTDDSGRYYYIHVKDTGGLDGCELNYQYLLQNSAMTDELNYVASDGYVSELYLPYINKYTGLDRDIYCRSVNVNDDHVHVSGDEYCIWFYTKPTLMISGEKASGFYFEGHFLERMNSSVEPVLGLADVPEIDIEAAKESNEFVFDEEPVISDTDIIISYIETGDLDSALKHISGLSEKTEEIADIESQIINFQAKYKKWLGKWSYSKSQPKEALWIRAGYDNGVVLQFETGKTTSGATIFYDVIEEGNDYIIYHSDRFDVFSQTTVTYVEDGKIHCSTYISNTGTKIEKDMYLIS